MKNKNQLHAFHLVDPSPLPFISAIGGLTLTFGGVLYMYGYVLASFLYKFGIVIVIFMMYSWWRDVVREGTFESQHTLTVQKGLKLGMLLFIISEIMFFFAFFWGFFHSSFNPSIFIGAVWPPIGLIILYTWKIPFLNILILLISGFAVIWIYSAIQLPKRRRYANLFINIFLQPALQFKIFLTKNLQKVDFLLKVVILIIINVYTTPEAHCEGVVALKIIKNMNLQKVHVDHHLLLGKPVLILPETAYLPKGFLPLTRTDYMQAQLLGGKTLTGQSVNQYISLFVYSNKDNLFEFKDLGDEFKYKHLHDDKFLEIYQKYDCIKTGGKQSFFFINPLKSINSNFNSNARK